MESNNISCYKCIQMVHDNYDITHNPKVKEKYPLLYEEIVKHDKLVSSSWYNLSMKAYWEYLEYIDGRGIGYVSQIALEEENKKWHIQLEYFFAIYIVNISIFVLSQLV